MVDSVEHNEPTGDVVITISNTEDVITAKLVNGESTRMYSAAGGTITIPAEDFTDAITNHAKLTVQRGLNDYGGSITFLPYQESEAYDFPGALLARNGQISAAASSKTTDFIDVSLVSEMVVSGGFNSNSYAVLCCYDENREFFSTLIDKGPVENYHVIVDGSYRFVRASGNASSDRSLIVYYRNRG